MKHKSFSLLCYKDHIWSKIIITNLLNNNFIPSVIIQEDSKISQKKQDFYKKLIETSKDIDYLNNMNSIEDIINEYNINNKRKIEHLIVSNHNENLCKVNLQKYSDDILLLANTGIIKKDIFEIPKIGTFNCHPDKLPGYRGSVVFLRKILNNLSLGVTCHWVNEIVDTGNIVCYQDIIINNDDRLGDIVYKICLTSYELFEQVLTTSKIPNIVQSTNDTPCFKFPDESIIQECIDKLDLKKYNCINK